VGFVDKVTGSVIVRRKAGEAVIIGEGPDRIVVEVCDRTVKLRVTAPLDVKISRSAPNEVVRS
jgi:sRNA-binding carbon storage regulator CsrA